MKNISVKKLVIKILPFILLFYLSDKAGQAFRLSLGSDISQKVMHINNGFAAAFKSPLPSFTPQDLLVGVIGAALVALALEIKRQNMKKYRKGIEYGSARWGTHADIAPFIDPDFYNNVLLTQTERLTMESRPKNPALARNKNVLVIGGSGSGKTRFFVKPQIMQLHSSYVVTDPKGTVLCNAVGIALNIIVTRKAAGLARRPHRRGCDRPRGASFAPFPAQKHGLPCLESGGKPGSADGYL